MRAATPTTGLSWPAIIRMGLVQTSLGAIIVLNTSTLNRVMAVELALPAMLPGALVAWHYALQVLRPRWGFGTDMGRRSTPWITGGMAVLALGGFLASAATALMAASFWPGVALAAAAFTLIGAGAGAAGTSLLVLLARQVAPERRAPAATIVWLMMIAGFAVTAITAGKLLDPFSYERLMAVAAGISVAAFLIACLAIAGVEAPPRPVDPSRPKPPFREALADVVAEPRARLFAVFIFVSMLAYAAQDLILEPFAGLVFSMTPGESTKLSGIQHGGVLIGMILAALTGPFFGKGRFGSPVAWTIGGCLLSAAALSALAVGGGHGPGWPIVANVFFLGAANGLYAGAAIASMMQLAASGAEGREGTRMGVWGAAQAVAFGIGGFAGAMAADVAKHLTGSALTAYGAVFIAEAALFVVAAVIALKVARLDAGAPSGDAGRVLKDDDALAMAAGR
jgi:BCD family chlorophyll transporter-like MFS transporter